MKNFCFTLLAASSICCQLHGQNLVLNPGLESYITCPGFGQFGNSYINNWTKPSWGSTDYYHNNCTGIQPSQQTPHSGDGYLGLIGFNYGTEYREYATGELSAPLVAGTQYTVTFYVSLNDGYIQAIKELGAYFSTTVPGPFANSLHIAVIPQVENTGTLLSSTTNWMTVTGVFTAAGGEQFITIGNFRDDSSTTITQVGNVGSFGAYYFVDDVSVVAVPEGIHTIGNINASLIPGKEPGIYFLNLEGEKGKFNYEVYDQTGRIISKEAFTASGSQAKEINIAHVVNGIYFLKLQSLKSASSFKLLKF